MCVSDCKHWISVLNENTECFLVVFFVHSNFKYKFIEVVSYRNLMP